MSTLLALILLAVQEPGADIPLKAPEGWRGETITLPPGFAPKMTLRGVEKIRFAPGMFKPGGKDFFSYVFVFRVGPKQALTEKVIREEILVYYRGLAAAVGGKGIDISGFALDLKEEEAPAGVAGFTATLKWVEPFATKKPQTLRLELRAWADGDGKHRWLFCCASPAASKDPIWKTMREVRDRFLEAVPAGMSQSTRWPSFRGPGASGVADGQDLPGTWDVERGTNIRWRVPIPGLAHSSPVVWGDRVYVTSAVSGRGEATFKPGLYGDGSASEDRSNHRWIVVCIDRKTGKTLWTSTATSGVPREKRHIKATYANATPVTDGRTVVAFFGSQGLFAFTADGKKLWQKDLGRLNAGAYDAPACEWGTASSPVLFGDLVIVQCDTQGESFLLAADLATGETRWRTARDELPSWGTPTIVEGPKGPELVTNGSNFIRGYDPRTGKELWRLGGSSKITAPTPIHGDGLIYVTSGRHPERPLFAIRAGSRGDLTLERGARSSGAIAWSRVRCGPYMPTPLLYGGLLYTLANHGILDCYDAKTGEDLYRERVPHRGSGFSGSPVAADGRIYLPGEDGEIFVVRAGRAYTLLARIPMGETLMATPAIAGGTLLVRGRRHLFAIGR